jgi:hypothetical protein
MPPLACSLILTAGAVGIAGDALLQLAVGPLRLGNWGLVPYFAQHGRAESMTIAGGMMALFYALYALAGLPWTYACLALYGILLDLLFRWTRIYPSLDPYYRHLGYAASAFWGAIPMMLPLLFHRIAA